MTPKFDLLGRSKRFRWVNVTLLALMALAMIGLIVVAFQTIESERAERECSVDRMLEEYVARYESLATGRVA